MDAKNPTILTNVSEKIIAKKVEEFLKDPSKNIKFVPDAVEKKFYTSMIKMSLECVDELLNNMSIKIFDHEIKFDLVQCAQKEATENVEAPQNCDK